MLWKQLTRLTAVCAVVTVLLAGCAAGSPPAPGNDHTNTVQSGVLSVGSDLTYPPYAYFEDGQPAGFDVELTRALADRMGVRPQAVDTRFEQLISGVNAGQFDVIASALYVTSDRADVVHYIPYFTAGSSLIAPAGGLSPSQPEDLCGVAVGVIRGAHSVPMLQGEVSADCRRRGEPAIDVRVFPTDPEATQALRAGNVEVQLSDSAVAKHVADGSGGQLAITSPELLYPVPVGLAVARGNDQLADAIEVALGELRQSGVYDRLLAEYNLKPPDSRLVAEALGASNDVEDEQAAAFDWSYLLSLFVDPDFWWASFTVVQLSVLAWVLAGAFGLLLAIGRLSRSRWLALPCAGYVWFFRSLPLLVLVIVVYNVPQMVPDVRFILSNVFIAGLLALVLSESAYMSEIHRGGLLAVGADQHEAGLALGLGRTAVFRHVVLPQAFRVAIPALGNQFVTIVKLTSLLSVISLAEILLVAQRLYTQNFQVLETLLAAAFFYVAIVTIFDWLRAWLESRLDVSRRTDNLQREAPQDKDAHAPEIAQLRRPRHPHSGEVVVHAVGLRKCYGDATVLDGVDLDVHRGEVVAIVGPSGSGKTTLIRSLNQLAQIDSGSVEVAHEGEVSTTTAREASSVIELRRRVGMVFQRFNLFPHLTALDNVVLAPTRTGRMTRQKAAITGRELLQKVGVGDHAEKYPHQLSGGQQQRVAIARTLAMQPSVILFDEPTSALDPELVGGVLRVIAELATEGRTMIVVTHEMRFARNVADWVVFMEYGRIVEQGPPEQVFDNPRQERTQRFLAQVDAPSALVDER
jgi:polar amino acid transport system permease protein